MKVSFVFAKNTAWWAILSPLIAYVSKTDFSHSAILVEYDEKKEIFHSEWPMGRCDSLEKWLKIYDIQHIFTVEIPADSDLIPKILYWLRKEVRKPYSLYQLILILIYKKFPWSRFYLYKKVVNGDYSDVCSEFVASFIERFFTFNFRKSDDLIDLNDVFDTAKMINIHHLRGE